MEKGERQQRCATPTCHGIKYNYIAIGTLLVERERERQVIIIAAKFQQSISNDFDDLRTHNSKVERM